MSTKDTWGTGPRLLLAVGLGFLLVLAWQGGRMSAGDGGFFGMMDSRMHGEGHMMMGGHMDRTASEQPPRTFEGETGLQQCRAMMGTMTGMHRSMQSMMGMGARVDTSGSRDRRGMMGGRMGMMHEGMEAGAAETNPEQMRQLCRTMHEAMRAAMHGEPSTFDSTSADAFDEQSLDPGTEQWLRGARGFEHVEDRTGEEEVVVEVGAGSGLQYAPAAIRVDSGTTVRWQWTGRGGLHDVAFLSADVSTSLRSEEGAEFSYAFDEPGEYRYECTPHSGVGMRGAVIVGADSNDRG